MLFKINVEGNLFVDSNPNYREELFNIIPSLKVIDGKGNKWNEVESEEEEEDEEYDEEEEEEYDEDANQEEDYDAEEDDDEDDDEDDEDEKPMKKQKK